MEPLVVSFISFKRSSGKTTLLEEVLKKLLEKGCHPLVAKHCHGKVDVPQKDSWRFVKAGADRVVLLSNDGVFSIIASPIKDPIASLKQMARGRHLVLVEGLKEGRHPKVLVNPQADELSREVIEQLNVVAVYVAPEKASTIGDIVPMARVLTSADQVLELLEDMFVAHVTRITEGANCSFCGFSSCQDFARSLLYGKSKEESCPRLRSRKKVKLLVNGKEVPINNFVQALLSSALLALVKNLKYVPERMESVEILVEEA